jgi:transposase
MEHFVGIDVAKDRLDVHLRPSGEAFAVACDGKGLAMLVKRLQGLAPALVAMEATGGYETVVASALGAAQLPLAVVNPRQIRDFARATGKLAKTDRIDAAAAFSDFIRPTPLALKTATMGQKRSSNPRSYFTISISPVALMQQKLRRGSSNRLQIGRSRRELDSNFRFCAR